MQCMERRKKERKKERKKKKKKKRKKKRKKERKKENVEHRSKPKYVGPKEMQVYTEKEIVYV